MVDVLDVDQLRPGRTRFDRRRSCRDLAAKDEARPHAGTGEDSKTVSPCRAAGGSERSRSPLAE